MYIVTFRNRILVLIASKSWTRMECGTSSPNLPFSSILLISRSKMMSDFPNKVLPAKTAFTRCRQILKTVKNVTVAKFELAFTRCRNNLKTVGILTTKASLQILIPKKYT